MMFKKIFKISLITIVVVIFLAIAWLVLEFRDPAPEGEGSYSEAAVILAELEELALDAESLPEGCYRMGKLDGFHYYVIGTDSHKGDGGGTMGIKFPDQSIHLFFGHVCGEGPTPLEFSGGSKDEVLDGLRLGWEEYEY